METEKVYKNLSAIGLQVDGQPYIYDRYTNHILKVDDVVYEILDDSLVSSFEEVLEKYSNQFKANEIEKAYTKILNMQENQGLFTPYVIPELSISSSQSVREKVRQKLKGGLSELVFNVTEDCNLRCRYCIYSGAYKDRRKHNKQNNISLDTAKKAIDFFLNNSGETEQLFISFYGGEALLRFDFIRQVITSVHKKNPELSFAITSNGTLITPAILDFLSEHKVRLSLSVDGPQEIHDANRIFANNKGTFKRVEKNIQLIRDKYPDYYSRYIKINTVVVPHKCGEQALNEFFSSERFSFLSDETKFKVGLVNPTENDYIPKTGYYPYLGKLFESLYRNYIEYHCQNEQSEIPSLESKLLGRKTKLIHYRSHSHLKDYDFFWPNGICLPGMRSLFVSADGSFYPCEKLYDYQDMKIGDINSGFDYDKISQYIEDYIKCVYKICSSCWAFRFCGECFLSLRHKGRNDIKMRLWYCQSQKKSIIEHLKMYIKIRSCKPDAFDYLEKDRKNASYTDYMIED